MKKIMFILIVVISFFSVNVYATEYYSEFNIDTVFYDGLGPNSFDTMYVYMIDDKGVSYEIPLSSNNGFSYSGNISYNNTLGFSYGMVAGDNIGKYKIVGVLNNHNSRFNLVLYVYDSKANEETPPPIGAVDIDGDDDQTESLTTQPIFTDDITTTTTAEIVKEKKDNTSVYNLYLAIGIIIGIFVLLLVVKGLVKISNANK